MGPFLSSSKFVVEGRTVLIPGGSSGLGLEAGRQLAEKGANIIIVARNVDRLKSSIDYISQGAGSSSTQHFHHLSADLRSAAECERAIAEATALNNDAPPDIVWCCQGSAHPTLFINTPVSKFHEMMDQNYFSSLYIAHAILNRWLRPSSTGTQDPKTKTRPPRHLVFTSSFVSFLTFTGYSPYSPSKLALRSLCETLAQEMHLYAGANPDLQRVRIHTVYPATIRTPGLEVENTIKSDVGKMLEDTDEGETPAECARASIKELEKGMEVVTTRWLTWLVWCGQMGASLRGGFWRGLGEWMMGLVVGLVLIGVRWDFDRKVEAWGRMWGDSGMKRENGK
ncbi:MAG: hypothetical protein MMC23_004307 [Stictis urceolatum]|nr:hypothetical protein [Stictis urceolata]